MKVNGKIKFLPIKMSQTVHICLKSETTCQLFSLLYAASARNEVVYQILFFSVSHKQAAQFSPKEKLQHHDLTVNRNVEALI